MSRFTSRSTGRLIVFTGLLGILAVVTLLLFFLSFLQGMHLFARMGALNDGINALLAVLSAILAAVLYPVLRGAGGRLNGVVLTGAWTGAAAVVYGSWLIMTGRSDVERSSYFYFFGFGLIGVWLWTVNRVARVQEAWPKHLTRWGQAAGGLMMVGLLGLAGILMGWDGGDTPPLVQACGLSYLGTGLLYPAWCLRTGRWVLSRQEQPLMEGALHE